MALDLLLRVLPGVLAGPLTSHTPLKHAPPQAAVALHRMSPLKEE